MSTDHHQPSDFWIVVWIILGLLALAMSGSPYAATVGEYMVFDLGLAAFLKGFEPLRAKYPKSAWLIYSVMGILIAMMVASVF
jgi:hypothetical protein